MGRPITVSSLGERELDKAEAQFQAFDESVKSLTLDRMNETAKKEETAPKEISEKEINKDEIYLKPVRSLGPGANPKTGEREKFNERFRSDYEFAKEYVKFIAYNNEIGGEAIECWTKPFPGTNTEEWRVPVNRSVWGPRHLAERFTKCRYHRLKSQESTITSADGLGTYHGAIVADTIVQRLDAQPVSSRKSLFMGASDF